jgi:hypothetical protein
MQLPALCSAASSQLPVKPELLELIWAADC